MNIKNNITVGAKTTSELYAAMAKEKEEKLAIGQKVAGQANDAAVALSITAKSVDTSDAARENIESASSMMTDVSKAEEMIREANRRILAQADDAVLAQANQTVAATSELLK